MTCHRCPHWKTRNTGCSVLKKRAPWRRPSLISSQSARCSKSLKSTRSWLCEPRNGWLRSCLNQTGPLPTRASASRRRALSQWVTRGGSFSRSPGQRAESPRAHARPPPVARAPTYASARASRVQISTIQSATIAKTKSQARSRTLWSRKSWLRSMLDNATETNGFSKEEARLCTAGLLLLNTESPKQVSARSGGSRGAARQYH
jgi:hypothetical protein